MARWLIGLVVMLLVAGCGPLGQPDAEEIVRRAEAAIERLDQAHAVIEVDATTQGKQFQLVGEGWVQDQQHRFVVRQAEGKELEGTVAVSDGETGWLYHPDSETVLTGDLETLETYKKERKELPAGMDFESLSELVDEILRVTDAELVDTETIASMETWHLRLTPNEEAPREWVATGGVIDLWIDQEYDLPLQLTFSGSEMGEGRVTVQELDLDPSFEPGLFTFSPPEGAEVIDVATLLPERMTLPEAREQAAFPLLSTPSDSAETTLVDLYRVGEAYVQQFEGTAGEWQLWQSPAGETRHQHLPDGGEPVTVRGVEGTLYTDEAEGLTILTWEADGRFVKLSGRLAQERALELAESLE